MNEIEVFPIQPGDHRLIQVAELFRQLYVSEAAFGVSLPLVPDGEKFWLKSIESKLGKFAQIVVAADEEKIAGFSYGSIKITPPYFGSKVVGYWEAMILLPEYRGRGLGDRMTRMLEDWYRSRNAVIFEGERLIANKMAAGNFERLGYKEELVKYRKPADLQ